jgi:hypothetical protein
VKISDAQAMGNKKHKKGKSFVLFVLFALFVSFPHLAKRYYTKR